MSKANQPITLLTDQAIYESGKSPGRNDYLDFEAYASVIHGVIEGTPGPFTIGIFGEWGTGKTSLMRIVESSFTKSDTVIPIWFNAWKFEKVEAPIVPLVATLIRELEARQPLLQKLEGEGKTLLRALRTIAYGFSGNAKVKLPGFGELEAGFTAKDMIEREERLAYDPLLEKTLYHRAFETLDSVNLRYNDKSVKILIIIDDLDRCFPENAVRLLESIKLVLSQPGFLFVLGVSRTVIEDYLEYKYQKEYGISDFKGGAYLDKIIQLPFDIPPHNERMKNLAGSLIEQLELDEQDKSDLRQLNQVIGSACNNNPRTVVRFINRLVLDESIYKRVSKKASTTPIGYFAVTRSLQQEWKAAFKILTSENGDQGKLCCQAVLSLVNQPLEKVTDEDEEAPTQFQTEIAKLREIWVKDQNLRTLLSSDIGQKWLEDDALRAATLKFTAQYPDTNLQEKQQEGVKVVRGYQIEPNADLRGAVLDDCDLSHASLTEANLRGAKLRNTLLIDADLIGADLSGVNMIGATLTGANLTGATLKNTVLGKVDLAGANLNAVKLHNTDLRQVKNFRHSKNYNKISCDKTTVCTPEQIKGTSLESRVTVKEVGDK